MNGPPHSLLHELIRKEARSLLQYLSDAYPWAPAQDQDKLHAIMARSKRERESLGNLVRFCVRHQLGYPPLGAYPSPFMDLNFISLDSMIPMLVSEQKQRLGDLEWAILTIPEPARDLVRGFVDVKRQTLAELERIASPASHPVAKTPAASAVKPAH